MTDTFWNLAIHGGAGIITPEKMKPGQESAIKAALSHALERGAAILRSGGSSIDAVEAAVQVLEDDPNFNAGRGAALSLTVSLNSTRQSWTGVSATLAPSQELPRHAIRSASREP